VTEPKRLAKRTAVRDIEHHLDIGSNIVGVGDDLVHVARRAIGQPQTRLLSVVDEGGRLVGVLPVLRVVEEIVARAHPEALMAEVTDLESAARFGREVGALVAGDLMSPPVALQETSTVADAFRAMHDHHYSGLPLVSDDGRVIGYVDLLELALRYLEDYPLPASDDEPASGRPHEADHSASGATD
jgi:CBS domain-containing protein